MFKARCTAFTLVAATALLGCAAEPEQSSSTEAARMAAQPSGAAGGAAPAPTGDRSQPPATNGDAPAPSGGDGPLPTAGEPPALADEPASSPEGEYTDPVGVWWTEVETVGSEMLPWVGNLMDADIRFVMRVEVTGTAPNHQVTLDFCQLQTEWIDPVDPNNITTIGFRPETVATFGETIEADLGGLSPGSDIPLPALTFRGGVDESGMDFDEDGDGFPAVTAWVRTLIGIQIEVYETIEIDAALNLTATDDDTLEGTVDFGADAMILSSNNPIIFADYPVTITSDSAAVPLTVKRIPGNPSCSELPSTITFTDVPPAPPSLIPPQMPAPTPTP